MNVKRLGNIETELRLISQEINAGWDNIMEIRQAQAYRTELQCLSYEVYVTNHRLYNRIIKLRKEQRIMTKGAWSPGIV